jgi:hypothetical protein
MDLDSGAKLLIFYSIIVNIASLLFCIKNFNTKSLSYSKYFSYKNKNVCANIWREVFKQYFYFRFYIF